MIAIHKGGPAGGLRVSAGAQTQTRYWAPADQRASDGWVELARYVFESPRDGALCWYRYSGVDVRRGPVPGDLLDPDWSSAD